MRARRCLSFAAHAAWHTHRIMGGSPSASGMRRTIPVCLTPAHRGIRTRAMQILALITNFVSRMCETCVAMVDLHAAAERDVMCPRCGGVNRPSDHPIWLGWARALLIAA